MLRLKIMGLKCPNCDGFPIQGSNYEKILALAETGTFEGLCGTCGHSWKPSPADQKVIAANVRRMIAEVPA